jgi:hypothetical protein
VGVAVGTNCILIPPPVVHALRLAKN